MKIKSKNYMVSYKINGYYLYEYCEETGFTKKYDLLDSRNLENKKQFFQIRLKIYAKRNYDILISAMDMYSLHKWGWL